MGTIAIMTVPKRGDLGSCHCEASSVIAKPAGLKQSQGLRRLPYNIWLSEHRNDGFQG